MSYKHLLPLLGLVLIGVGLVEGRWLLFLIWLGADFLILGLAHWRHAHRVFGKTLDGALPFWSWLLFLPLLTCNSAVWHLLRVLSREPSHSQATDNLVVGRRLLASEVDGSFDNYVDLTAEFVEPAVIRRSPGYRCFPLLDGAAPTPDALRQAVSSLQPGRTFVHCAQGHGRTGLFALALLLSSGAAHAVDEGLRMLKAARPGIRLNHEQQRCIQAYVSQLNPSARPSATRHGGFEKRTD